MTDNPQKVDRCGQRTCPYLKKCREGLRVVGSKPDKIQERLFFEEGLECSVIFSRQQTKCPRGEANSCSVLVIPTKFLEHEQVKQKGFKG